MMPMTMRMPKPAAFPGSGLRLVAAARPEKSPAENRAGAAGHRFRHGAVAISRPNPGIRIR